MESSNHFFGNQKSSTSVLPCLIFFRYSTKMDVEKAPPIKKVEASCFFPSETAFLCCLICYNRKKKKEGKKWPWNSLIRRQWNYPPTSQTIVEQWGWSGRSEDYGCPRDLCRKWPHDPSWILACTLQWITTRCQEIRKVSKVPIVFLSSRDQAMDNIVMAINMGERLCRKPFVKMSSLPRSRTLAALRIWDKSKFAGTPGSHPQSQKIHRLDVPGKSLSWPRMNFSLRVYLNMRAYRGSDDMMKGSGIATSLLTI